jgi:hypothetical protein
VGSGHLGSPLRYSWSFCHDSRATEQGRRENPTIRHALMVFALREVEPCGFRQSGQTKPTDVREREESKEMKEMHGCE